MTDMLLIGAAVAAAVWYMARKVRQASRSGACGCGCSGCKQGKCADSPREIHS